MTRFKKYLEETPEKELRVIVSVKKEFIENFKHKLQLEAKETTVGKYTAYKHQPHFQGGEYHGHSDTEGGRQVSWTMSGKRLHPNKFPTEIPNDARIAVAKVLGVPAKKLESYIAYDEVEGKEVLLLELREENGIKQRLSRLFERMK